MSRDLDKNMQRRHFIKAGTLLTAGLTLPQIQGSEAQRPVRKNLICLPPTAPDLVRYCKAVDLMKKRPESDPESLAALAKTHVDHAPHSNWWFLPWHRAFVFYFEEICRDVLKKDDPSYRDDPPFRLPYWEWSRYPYVPEPFLDHGSPLYFNGRNSDGQVQVDCELAGAPNVDWYLQEPASFHVVGWTAEHLVEELGGGWLEGSPHNTVHAQVGGVMLHRNSPLDPLFWVHHCNVDRIWESWLALHARAVPSEKKWGDQPLTSFFDPASPSLPASPRCADTVRYGQFGAQYDRLETVFGCNLFESLPSAEIQFGPGEDTKQPGPRPEILLPRERKVDENRVAFSFDISEKFLSLMEKNPHLRPLRSRPVFPYFAVLLDQAPNPHTPTTAVRAFLNTPGASAATRSYELGFLGTVSFFPAVDSTMTPMARSFSFNIGPALARLKASGVLANTLEISLVSVDLADSKAKPAPVTPEKVRIAGFKGDGS